MFRRHASLIVGILLMAFVATACLIRTHPNRGRRSQPVYVEKHKNKKQKHKKQAKKHRKNVRKHH